MNVPGPIPYTIASNNNKKQGLQYIKLSLFQSPETCYIPITGTYKLLKLTCFEQEKF